MTPRKKESWLLAGVLGVTALAYLNSLSGGWVYDDRFQIVRNATLQAPGALGRIFTESVWQFLASSTYEQLGPYYRPFFTAALILQYKAFGLSPLPWHVVSIVVHLLATFLVYRLALAWRLEATLALAAALLFGLHPTHAESVAWISGIPDPMAAVFLLASLLLLERGLTGATSLAAAALGGAGLGFLAMLSKETAIVLPALVLARAFLAEGSRDLAFPRRAGRALLASAPFFAASGVALLLRLRVLGAIGSVDPTSTQVTALQVALTLPSVVLSYLSMLAFPFRLAIVYGLGYVGSPSETGFWLPLLVLLVVLGAVSWLVRYSPLGLSALALLLVFIGPVLSLKALNFKESLLHDRYLYLPSIGFSLLVAMGLGWLARRWRREALVWGLLVLSTASLALTVRQNTYFRDDVALVERALDVAGPRPFLYNLLGAYHFMERRDYEAAARALERALEVDPGSLDARLNLAEVRRAEGRLPEAEAIYRRAMEIGSPPADAFANLGVVLLQQGKLDESEPFLRRALALSPEHTGARYNLAWAYGKAGRAADAEREYREVTRRDPSSREAWINLGILLAEKGALSEAESALLSAGKLDPGNPTVLYHLADVLRREERCPEALRLLGPLVSANPGLGPAQLSLGLCLESTGRAGEAQAALSLALQTLPDEERRALARQHLDALAGKR